MNEVSTIGLDLAKNVFQVHGVDEAGKVVVRRQLRRSQVIAFFKKLAPCLVGMEPGPSTDRLRMRHRFCCLWDRRQSEKCQQRILTSSPCVTHINRPQFMGSPAVCNAMMSASIPALSARNWVFAQAAMVKSRRTDRSCSAVRLASAGRPVC